MGCFEFTTEEIEVGYGEDGFFAFGSTTSFKFDPSLWGYDPYPAIRPFKLEWRVDSKGECQWKRYDYMIRGADEQVTAREDAIKRVFTDPLVGLFWRPFPEKTFPESTISLSY